MNNEKTIVTEQKRPPYQKRGVITALAILLAVLILANAALALLLALGDKAKDDGAKENAAFDYASQSIKDYFAAFSADLFKGNTYAGKELAIDKTDMQAYAKKYINSMILAQAAVADSGKTNKTELFDYADKVYFYILFAEKVNGDGTTSALDTDYFGNAYAQMGELQIGSLLLGEEFEKALLAQGKAPIDLGNAVYREHGLIGDGEETVVIVSYEAKIDGEEDVFATVNGVRVDLAQATDALDKALKAKLADGKAPIGETFKLDVTHDIDEDEDEELVHYTVTLNAAVTEEAYTIDAALPEDFFGESDDNAALNGQKLRFHIIVDHSVAYEVSYTPSGETNKVYIKGFDDLTPEYIGTVLEASQQSPFTTDKTDAATVRAEYLAHYVKKLTESYDSTVKSNAVTIIWKNLLEDITFDSLPEDAIEEIKQSALQSVNSYYSAYASYFGSIEKAASYYFGYDTEEYESYTEYIEEKLAPDTVKQNLLIYAIYKSGVIENAYGKYTELLDKHLDQIIASAASQSVTLTRDEALDYAYYNSGAEKLKSSFISQIVNDYLYENNAIDWELSDEDAN